MNAKMKLNMRKLKENLFVYSLIIYPLILFVIFYVIVNEAGVKNGGSLKKSDNSVSEGFNIRNEIKVKLESSDSVHISAAHIVDLVICFRRQTAG